jgi:hypothetical protein
LSVKSIIACHVFIVPTNNISASTYCENLVPLTLKKLFILPTTFEISAEASVKYLSVTCVRSYSCEGNSLYFLSTLIFCFTAVISPSTLSLNLTNPSNHPNISPHLPRSFTTAFTVSNFACLSSIKLFCVINNHCMAFRRANVATLFPALLALVLNFLISAHISAAVTSSVAAKIVFILVI